MYKNKGGKWPDKPSHRQLIDFLDDGKLHTAEGTPLTSRNAFDYTDTLSHHILLIHPIIHSLPRFPYDLIFVGVGAFAISMKLAKSVDAYFADEYR